MDNMDTLDIKILQFINKNPGLCPANSQELSDIAEKLRPNAMFPWRVVDYRLRRMRENNVIYLNEKRKWSVVK